MKYEVAVLYDTNGNIVSALKCKVVDENEYNQLIEKTKRYLDSKNSEKKKLEKRIDELKEEINELKKDIKVLKGEE